MSAKLKVYFLQFGKDVPVLYESMTHAADKLNLRVETVSRCVSGENAIGIGIFYKNGETEEQIQAKKDASAAVRKAQDQQFQDAVTFYPYRFDSNVETGECTEFVSVNRASIATGTAVAAIISSLEDGTGCIEGIGRFEYTSVWKRREVAKMRALKVNRYATTEMSRTQPTGIDPITRKSMLKNSEFDHSRVTRTGLLELSTTTEQGIYVRRCYGIRTGF